MNDLLPAIRPRIRDSEALFEQIDCRIPMSLIVRNDSKPAKGFYPHLDRHFRRVENAIVKLLRRIPLTSICRELAFVIRHDSFFEWAQHAIVFVDKFDERLTLPEAHFLPTLAAKMFEFGQPFPARRADEMKHAVAQRLLNGIGSFCSAFIFPPRCKLVEMLG